MSEPGRVSRPAGGSSHDMLRRTFVRRLKVQQPWRLAIRSIFQTYFSKAYRAVDFFLSQASGRGQYLLALGPE